MDERRRQIRERMRENIRQLRRLQTLRYLREQKAAAEKQKEAK